MDGPYLIRSAGTLLLLGLFLLALGRLLFGLCLLADVTLYKVQSLRLWWDGWQLDLELCCAISGLFDRFCFAAELHLQGRLARLLICSIGIDHLNACCC